MVNKTYLYLKDFIAFINSLIIFFESQFDSGNIQDTRNLYSPNSKYKMKIFTSSVHTFLVQSLQFFFIIVSLAHRIPQDFDIFAAFFVFGRRIGVVTLPVEDVSGFFYVGYDFQNLGEIGLQIPEKHAIDVIIAKQADSTKRSSFGLPIFDCTITS